MSNEMGQSNEGGEIDRDSETESAAAGGDWGDDEEQQVSQEDAVHIPCAIVDEMGPVRQRGEIQSIGEIMGDGLLDYLRQQAEKYEKLRAAGCGRERDGVRCAQPVKSSDEAAENHEPWFRRRRDSRSWETPISAALTRRLPFDRRSVEVRIEKEDWWGKFLCDACEADAIRAIEAAHHQRLARHLASMDAELPYMFRWAKPKAPEVDQRIPARARKEAAAVLPLMLKAEPEVAALTLAGPAGTGKTSLSNLLIRYIFGLALEAPLDSDIVRIACGIKYISSWDLIHGSVGQKSVEPEAIFRGAIDAPLVVVDDVGAERDGKTTLYGELVTEFISKRFHRGKRPPLPTIYTTPLNDEAAVKLYGGGVARRFLTDDGGLVRVIRFDAKLAKRVA